ncbi:MAG TPA: NADH:ubiquinone oxidoreductase subunit NDUFA12 [Alphaproteobacteria bacterium]|nr:NADH:ubiquinone oxidoreductase subunit NDUFA12 [Rhodospirillaceae bacterium]HRJ11854.1 NADH:ubiquinone oxidoreductase subunit NDUFA12 [Alphaproteobacteria bacterium]
MNFDFLSPLLGSLSRVHIHFVTMLRGNFVARDEFGNKYYQSRKATAQWQGGATAQHKRWVIYAHRADGSEVPPEFHGWLHHQTDILPSNENANRFRRRWQKPYVPNMTGTNAAYLPPGHQLSSANRAKATGDYQAWRPH